MEQSFITHYDPALVALSIVIAVLAAYTALVLGERASASAAQARSGWIAAAAVAMGGGIWSMHFVGMLALKLPDVVTYELGRTIVSLCVAIVATAAGFFWVSWPRIGVSASRAVATTRVGFAGLLMGFAIAGMHYIGMSAMQAPMSISFTTGRVALSVIIAIVASTAGLSIAFRQQNLAIRIAAAIVMGLAVSGMHYTGMWAAHFTPTDHGAAQAMTGMHDGSGVLANGIGPTGLILAVVFATFLILFLALLASTVTQHRSQRLLRRSEARFRVAAEAVGDIIWTNTAEGRMEGPQLDWSRFTGQSPSEYEGFGWAKAIHPDDVDETYAAWEETVRTRTNFRIEHRVRRADGVWRLCAVRAVPILDETGQLTEWVGVHEDITEEREAESELRAARDRAEAASQVKSNFIANVSHELRTPLSAIIGYTEMLTEELEEAGESVSPSSLLADLGKIDGNARHLLGLISDILDLTKIEAGRMDVLAEDVDLRDLLAGIEVTVRPLVERSANRFRCTLPTEPIRMHTDVVKLRQMLLNLLSNAAKFTQGGTVRLTVGFADPSGLVVRFDIADTGIGMTPEQVQGLFKRFAQADTSTTRRFGGTGLGLALTKAFATMLGGEIAVQSALGAGSTFTLTVPAHYTVLDTTAESNAEVS